MNYNTTKFINDLKAIGIELSDEQIEQFLTYYEMLIEKNKVMNLTAITDFDEVLEKHFEDSLSLIQAVDLEKSQEVIDLGTGAGFPGITLADSLNKRILFLDDVICELGLTGIDTVHGRAEDLAKNSNYREKFDLCVSRAVANLSTLSEYCLPFVKIGGKFISYKAGECDEEVAASKSSVFLLGGKISDIKKFELGESGRAFVIIDKVSGTPKKYPRKAGTPSKDPL